MYSFNYTFTSSVPMEKAPDAELEKYRPEGFQKFNATLSEWCDLFLTQQAKAVRYRKRDSTLQTYKTRIRNLRLFLRSVGAMAIRPEQITLFFAEDFECFLRSKKHSNDYVMKNILMLRKVLKQCVIHGQIKYNPLDSFEFHYERKFKSNHLSQEDLTKIRSATIAQDRLEKVRDCFVFCCFTGLAYSDLAKFDYGLNTYLRNGKRWIRISREKTENDAILPLLPEAMVILEKYDFVLPVSSNATMNSYLKEVADICGLTCELTTHVARKTFGMYMLNELKYPLEVVSRMLGHNSVRTTQTWYVKIEEGNIERYAYR